MFHGLAHTTGNNMAHTNILSAAQFYEHLRRKK